MRRLVTAAILCVVAACAGDAGTEAARSYVLGLTVDDSQQRYRYVAEDPVDIRVGDEVTFELQNTGALAHDLRVVDPDGTTIAGAEPAAPGETASVTVLFDEAGFFRLRCLVDDHLTVHDMQQAIEVGET